MFSTISHSPSALFVITPSELVRLDKGSSQVRSVPVPSRPLFIKGPYIVDGDKNIIAYDEDLNLAVVGRVQKRITQMAIEKDGGRDVLYTSDRAGNVYRTDVAGHQSETKLLFGSISMITDMLIHEDTIITSDKDNKIRVTGKSHPHVIEKFILHHTQPVTSMCILRGRYLLSGGYDTYIAAYDLAAGQATFIDLAAPQNIRVQSKSELFGPEAGAKAVLTNKVDAGAKFIIKLVASRDRLLVLRADQLILLELPQAPGPGAPIRVGAAQTFDIPPCDGAAVGDHFLVSTREKRIIEITSSNEVVEKGFIGSYDASLDYGLLEKRIEHR